jgi:hypothetical protein
MTPLSMTKDGRSKMEQDGIDWYSFVAGFAAALILMLFWRWRKGRRRRQTDLTAPPPASPVVASLPADLRAQVLLLKANGRQIEAIKIVRSRMVIDLAAAKDVVDKVR